MFLVLNYLFHTRHNRQAQSSGEVLPGKSSAQQMPEAFCAPAGHIIIMRLRAWRGNDTLPRPLADRKENKTMETTGDGTFFQEGDQVRLKRTGETGRINATAGGVVYVLMDATNESKLFAAYIDEDAAIELVTEENATDK
jgi:hypothetical protein